MKCVLMSFAFAILLIQNVHAAPIARSEDKYLSVREALNLPLENRISALKAQGQKGESTLAALMFDDSASMDLRWKAVTAAGLIKIKSLKPQLNKALNSKEWFMRNAALVAMESVDQATAKTWAKKLLNDKSLVVRSAAVDTISRLEDNSAVSLLWQKLQSKENFRGHQSLWIRKQITAALAHIDKSSSQAKFVGLLEDRDESVQGEAVKALELRTGQQLGGEKEPVKFKKAYWQQWWKEREV